MQVDAHTASLQYYPDGMLNVAENCIDRHLADGADKVFDVSKLRYVHMTFYLVKLLASDAVMHSAKVALLWEKDEAGESQKITYQNLHDEATEQFCRVALTCR